MPSIAISRLVIVGVILSAFGSRAHAQLARLGGEFPINETTKGYQEEPHVTPLPDGGFQVVWLSNGNIVARRFDSNGQPKGPEFQVNTVLPGNDPVPSMAAAPDGSSLIAWCAIMPPNQTGIVARRVDSDGSLDGPPFTLLDQGSYGGTTVAAAGSDQFVVAWTDDTTYVGRARLVTRNDELGSPFQVADSGQQYALNTASAADGSYRIVWYDEPLAMMQGRSFTGNDPNADVLSVDGVSSGSHSDPTVCVQPDGSFVVTWSTQEDDDLGFSIHLVKYRRYDASSRPLTDPLVATPDEVTFFLNMPRQGGPVLACGPHSQFMDVWEDSYNYPYITIRGRSFDGDMPEGDFSIGLVGSAAGFSVARLTAGSTVVVWADCGGPTGCDLFGQLFSPSRTDQCPGDCNSDGRVTIDELVQMVHIALSPQDAILMKQCLAGDVNLNYLITIDELILAVDRALGGCS